MKRWSLSGRYFDYPPCECFFHTSQSFLYCYMYLLAVVSSPAPPGAVWVSLPCTLSLSSCRPPFRFHSGLQACSLSLSSSCAPAPKSSGWPLCWTCSCMIISFIVLDTELQVSSHKYRMEENNYFIGPACQPLLIEARMFSTGRVQFWLIFMPPRTTGVFCTVPF